jgi:hypothetical protein
MSPPNGLRADRANALGEAGVTVRLYTRRLMQRGESAEASSAASSNYRPVPFFSVKEFSVYTFRSMYHNAGDALHRQAVERWMTGVRISDGPAHTAFKLDANVDPRITRVGKFIRRTSLDERRSSGTSCLGICRSSGRVHLSPMMWTICAGSRSSTTSD